MLDIGEGKSCRGCNYLKQILSVSGFEDGIPILPTCLVFQKQIKVRKGKAERLPGCVAAELEQRQWKMTLSRRKKYRRR
jgi:hypothetical protein